MIKLPEKNVSISLYKRQFYYSVLATIGLLGLSQSLAWAKPANNRPASITTTTAQKPPLLNPKVTQAIAKANSEKSSQGISNNNPSLYSVDDSDDGDGDEMDGPVAPPSNLPTNPSSLPVNPTTTSTANKSQNAPLNNRPPAESTTTGPANSKQNNNMSGNGNDAGDEAFNQVPLGAVAPETIAKFVKMIDIIRQDYVSNVDDERLFANAMIGTLTQLDPYSEYLDKTAFENLRLFTEGDIGSIGVNVSYHADTKAWVFDEVVPNSPAARAGIQRNYFLHQINDIKLSDEQTQQDINQLLTGIGGSQVRLVVSDQGRRKHNLTVQRSLVEQQTLKASVVQGIAVIHIPVFQNNTQQQVINALSNLNEPFSAILLDIRNNPGGVLSAANDVASLFMNNKTIAQVRNRHGLQEIIKTYGTAQFASIPLAILQNRYSASAAEVLAIGLQENGRAKIYGETSYGKGSIQSIVPLGNDEAVKLTVAHYYSGQGRKIDSVGVVPDYILNGNENMWENAVVDKLKATMPATSYRLQPSIPPQNF